MLATRAGTLADLFKQLVLANAFAIQRPAEYWESHAQAAISPADPSDQHGVNRFLKVAPGNFDLAHTALYRILEPLRKRKDVIAGTSWLAMRALGKDARRFLFCGQDAAALQSILAECRSLNILETKVECIQEDGVALLRGATMVLSEHWTASTLAFIDAPQIEAVTDAGISPLELWCEIANRGIPAMLGFGFSDTASRIAVRRRIMEAVQKTHLTGRKMFRFEGSLTQTSEVAPPIPWGFGVMCANVPDAATTTADRECFMLQSSFAGTTIEGWGDGMWKYFGEAC
ncbi:MAG TPA: hypothetical protein VM008_18335 [Phycisphaerae bacterium]|nr:hypothetical protein [Phycisphaerae bacterium]